MDSLLAVKMRNDAGNWPVEQRGHAVDMTTAFDSVSDYFQFQCDRFGMILAETIIRIGCVPAAISGISVLGKRNGAIILCFQKPLTLWTGFNQRETDHFFRADSPGIVSGFTPCPSG